MKVLKMSEGFSINELEGWVKLNLLREPLSLGDDDFDYEVLPRITELVTRLAAANKRADEAVKIAEEAIEEACEQHGDCNVHVCLFRNRVIGLQSALKEGANDE
jgi:hypothetical protein